jgi:hypothetical protein
MPWIKRNLAVVISAAAALGLIGFGVWYLMGAMEKNKTMDDEIGSLTNEINNLSTAQFYPSASNITIAQTELKRVNDFVGQAKKFFPAAAVPAAPLDNQTFAPLLHNTIDELAKQAIASGIRVESNYHFSFESEWLPVSFPPASLQPLSERLAEVKQLASILFAAKVNRLEAIRRARVTDEVPGPTAAADYVNDLPYTSAETGMTMWPYEVVFQSFSPELATVLESIARMPEAYVVRSVVVNPAESLPQAGAGQPPPGAPPPGGQFPGRGRGVPGRPGPAAAAPAIETILNERLLRVVLRVEVIKPNEQPNRPGPGGVRQRL